MNYITLYEFVDIVSTLQEKSVGFKIRDEHNDRRQWTIPAVEGSNRKEYQIGIEERKEIHAPHIFDAAIGAKATMEALLQDAGVTLVGREEPNGDGTVWRYRFRIDD